MEKKSLAGTIVLAVIVVALLALPMGARASVAAGGASSHALVAPTHSAAAVHPSPAAPAPMTTYPRTVLVETFTAQWCIYCEMESQAWYSIQHQLNLNIVDVGELHVCYSSTNCGDGYITADGTSNTRSSFYHVSAFPDVFFDGTHQVLGAANTLSDLEAMYESRITNASAVPGNVSITQSAILTTTSVTSHASITSAINGTYHAITYLIEHIGKNDSTGHDIDYVVRESLADQTVTLTAGGTIQLIGNKAIGMTWNTQHMSVITFVQQNSTKIVENTNMVPVTTLTTAVSVDQVAVSTGTNATITVHVANSSTSAGVVGATVALTSSNGGTLSPAIGVTDSSGRFTSTITGPDVASPISTVLTAQVTAAGYTAGTGTTTITLNPLQLSRVASGLTIAPSAQQVALNWTTPAAGGVGVTYYVYRATAEAGPYSFVGTSTTLDYVDAGLLGGQSYWYEVSSLSALGFSANTTAVPATAVTAVTEGLPTAIGWWITIDSVTFTSPSSATLSLYLPEGIFDYEFGPSSYAFVATESTGTLGAAGLSLDVTASFAPRYASLEGTVTPVTAAVTVDDTPVAVVGGSFTYPFLEAGTHTVVVTASGYETNNTSVALTPGNTTTLSFSLHPVPAPSGGAASADQWLGGDGTAKLAVIAAIGAAAVLGAVIILSRKGKRAPPRTP